LLLSVGQDQGSQVGDPRGRWVRGTLTLQAKRELEARGLQVVGPTNHDDFILSIYFFDPSGHRLELTARTAPAERLKVFEEEAPRVLALWNETHDWSRREQVFGAKSGYVRPAPLPA
jgi:glyoxylase I family protein